MNPYSIKSSIGWKIESSADVKPLHILGNPEPVFLIPRLITTSITKLTDNGPYIILCSYYGAKTCPFLDLFTKSMQLHNKEPSIEWVDYLFDTQYIALRLHPSHYIDKTYLQDINYTF
jgi:hypothetical protein